MNTNNTINQQAKAILLEAACLLERDGWTQNVGRSSSRRCMTTAIGDAARMVTGSTPAATEHVNNLLRAHLGCSSLTKWNDARGRTAETVLAALRRTADGIEEEEVYVPRVGDSIIRRGWSQAHTVVAYDEETKAVWARNPKGSPPYTFYLSPERPWEKVEPPPPPLPELWINIDTTYGTDIASTYLTKKQAERSASSVRRAQIHVTPDGDTEVEYFDRRSS